MIDMTTTTHYENYRCDKLTRLAGGEHGSDGPNKNPLAVLEDECKDHFYKVDEMKKEMQDVFHKQVEEKNKTLDVLKLEHKDDIEKENKALDMEKREVLSKRAEFEKEKTKWEAINFGSANRCSKSMESLRRKKKFVFSLGPVNFGRQ